MQTIGWIQIKKTSNGSWVDIPTPAKDGVTIEYQTIVDDGRDATGTIISSPVGQDKVKLSIKWPDNLTQSEVQKVLSLFDRERGGKFKVYVRFYDPRVGSKITRYMYVGDRSLKPYQIPSITNGAPSMWQELSVNLIEC